MNNLLDKKFFFRSQNLNYINSGFRDIKKNTEVEQIFSAIHSFSETLAYEAQTYIVDLPTAN